MTSSTRQGGSHKVDFGFLGIRLKSVENDELPKKIPKSVYQETMRVVMRHYDVINTAGRLS